MVPCGLRTVFPLKKVTVSLPVLVTETSATWALVPAMLTESGQAASAVPARATMGRMLEIILKTENRGLTEEIVCLRVDGRVRRQCRGL